MKQLLLAAVVLGLASCAHDSDELQYHKVQADRYEPTVHIEPEGNLQYMAFCTAEGRALGPWVDSKSEAQSRANEYHSEHPDRECTVLWRQKQVGRLIPKSQ